MSLGTVISLCDQTGNMVEPWLEAGYQAITVDLQEGRSGGNRYHMQGDVRVLSPIFQPSPGVVAAFAFPPCTNTAVSGARWFREKGLDGLVDGLTVLNACKKILERVGAPWMIENPVSTFSTYWREPDYTFHPSDFTGFELGDNYTKKTCLWTGNGFVMPDRCMATTEIPDDRIHKAPPGAERANFRSATPMGFARAVYLANAPHLKSRDGLDRQARNPDRLPDAGPKVENAKSFQEGITGSQSNFRQVGTPRETPSTVTPADGKTP